MGESLVGHTPSSENVADLTESTCSVIFSMIEVTFKITLNQKVLRAMKNLQVMKMPTRLLNKPFQKGNLKFLIF